MDKLKTLFSLSFAPLFLLYIYYVEVDKDSIFYLSARMIPTFLSFSFFVLFVLALLRDKKLVLSMAQKLYKNKLRTHEESFLAKSDFYWVGVTLVNTLIQFYLALYGSEVFWAFYSSIGWYFYIFGAIVIQIAYTKIYFYIKAEAT